MPVPGHAPVDARDVHVALDAISRDLGGGTITPSAELPFTERRALRRHPPNAEIGDYSFSMCFYAFLLPYYRDRMGSIDSAEQMVAVNDLHGIAGRCAATRSSGYSPTATTSWPATRTSRG